MLVKQEEISKLGHLLENNLCKNCGIKISEGLLYTLSEDETYYIVSGIGTCTDTDICIPSEYNGLPVKEIGDDAFKDCSSLTSITIPGTVTSIDKGAFVGCSSLTSVIFENPDGWYVTYTENATSGTDLVLTDASQNATYLKNTYNGYRWYRKQVIY